MPTARAGPLRVLASQLANPLLVLLAVAAVVSLGYIPNMEWFRVQLNRAVTLDRAKAHIAIAECERALRLRHQGIAARCFGSLER